MTLAAYLGRWGCCPTGSGRLCIKPKSVILETYNLMEFALLGCDFWGDVSPLPSFLFSFLEWKSLSHHCIWKHLTCLVLQVHSWIDVLPQHESYL